MCAKTTMWALVLGVVAAAGTASAQSQIPFYCRDVKNAPATCAKYYESVSRNGEIRQAPRGGNRQDSNQSGNADLDRTRNTARDTFLEDGQDRFFDSLPNTPGGKAIKKGYEAGKAIDSPVDYGTEKAIEKGLQRKFGKKLAEKIGNRYVNPGLTAVGIITEPIDNPKGYRDGQSRRPRNAYAAGLAEDALKNGYCLEKHRLVASGPTLQAGSPGFPAARPTPSRIPDNCASVAELTDYLNQYQREFDAIATQEKREWERQGWYQPFDSRELDGWIRYAEQMMNDPSVPSDLRTQLKDALSEMRAERKRQGGFIPSPSDPVPSKNDPIHDAWQRMDGNMSIKPWR